MRLRVVSTIFGLAMNHVNSFRPSVLLCRRKHLSIRKWSSKSVVDEIKTDATHKPFYRLYYNDVYEVILPPKHRFPMEKYAKVRRLIQKMISESQIPNIDCGMYTNRMEITWKRLD